MSAAAALRKRRPSGRVVAAAAGIGAAIMAAGSLGWVIAQSGSFAATAVLGLGASVIIYLVLEELLREAHETDTGPWEVAVLFTGFLPFFLIGIAAG